MTIAHPPRVAATPNAMSAAEATLAIAERTADADPLGHDWLPLETPAGLRVDSALVYVSGPLWDEPYRYWWTYNNYFPQDGVLSVCLSRDDALTYIATGKTPDVVLAAMQRHEARREAGEPARQRINAQWRDEVSKRGRTRVRDAYVHEPSVAGSPLQHVSKGHE